MMRQGQTRAAVRRSGKFVAMALSVAVAAVEVHGATLPLGQVRPCYPRNVLIAVTGVLAALGVAAEKKESFFMALVPAPQKMSVTDGTFTKCRAVTYARDAKIPAEGYRLKVEADSIKVWSSDAAGRFYADETLKQLAENGRIPLVEIEDAPRFPWRGILLDESRHFFGKETLKRTLDQMAWHKLNVLHWHLVDDQGWRLDIPGYPELVKYGAVRPESVRHGDRSQTNGVRYGPHYYAEQDVKDILAYAAARHIKVVPEIELPGHVYAVLAAYPELACHPGHLAKRTPRIMWGIEKDVLCLGNDNAIKFLEDVLDYVCQIFPSDVIHIGGDECPPDMWKTCPKCQARIKALGLKDEHDLQPWVTRHFLAFLAKRGKRALGWEEYLLGDVPKDAIGMSWRAGVGGAGHKFMSPAECVKLGHDVVMTPRTHCYLDYGQGLEGDPFEYIGGCVTLEKAYEFDPCEGIPAELRSHILGGQGNNWSAYTWNEYDLAWKMWPRMCALAEVFWLGEAKPGYADFKARVQAHRKRLVAQNVNCAPIQ